VPYPSGPFASTLTSYLSAPKKPWPSADFLSPFLRSPASATCPKFLSLWHSPRQRRSVTFVALEATVTFWRVRGTIFLTPDVEHVVIQFNVVGYSESQSSKYATPVASVSQQHWLSAVGVDEGQYPYVQAWVVRL